MKRLTAALLSLAAIVVLALPASAAIMIQYKQIGPLQFCTGCASATTGQTDSTAIYPGVAALDTSHVYAWPQDIAWGAVTDSNPIIVVVHREAAGASTDTVYTSLQTAYYGGTGSGKGTGTIPATFVHATWWFSQIALLGAGWGGACFNAPTRAAASTTCILPTYNNAPANSLGSTVFRVVCRAYSAATAPPKYSVFVRYPVLIK
jgi:hypothetical protein